MNSSPVLFLLFLRLRFVSLYWPIWLWTPCWWIISSYVNSEFILLLKGSSFSPFLPWFLMSFVSTDADFSDDRSNSIPIKRTVHRKELCERSVFYETRKSRILFMVSSINLLDLLYFFLICLRLFFGSHRNELPWHDLFFFCAGVLLAGNILRDLVKKGSKYGSVMCINWGAAQSSPLELLLQGYLVKLFVSWLSIDQPVSSVFRSTWVLITSS